MGASKPLLAVEGGSLLGWVLGRLAPNFAQVMVSVADREAELPDDLQGAELVFDLHRNHGPLAGIEAGLAHSRHDALFVVACDMPWVDITLARRLVEASAGHDAAVPMVAGRPEPLCATYRASAAPELGMALRESRLQARAALAGMDVSYQLELDSHRFRNLNTPEDYRAFLAALR